jgi:cytoskeletal protein CcmA (bactofilin family)
MKQPAQEIKAFLGKNNTVEGKMSFEGIFHLEGQFEGEISGSGTLILAESAAVRGKIGVESVVVKGYVEGEICARARVEIHSKGCVRGCLTVPVLLIQEGGRLDGQCLMNGNAAIRTAKESRDSDL